MHRFRILTLLVVLFSLPMSRMHAQDTVACTALDGLQFATWTYYEGMYEGRGIITFLNGRLDMANAKRLGFQGDSYQCQVQDSVITVTAVLESISQGVMELSGRIANDRILAEIVWKKPGQEPLTFNVHGTASLVAADPRPRPNAPQR